MRLLLKSLGPGIITGAADDDPSGIATYSVGGAQLGTKLLWTALLTWPMMAAVQMMCARIGKVIGKGLTGNFSQRLLTCTALEIENPRCRCLLMTWRLTPQMGHRYPHIKQVSRAPNATSWRDPENCSRLPSLDLAARPHTTERAIATSFQQPDCWILLYRRLNIGEEPS